eukprot:CFRG3165T1
MAIFTGLLTVLPGFNLQRVLVWVLIICSVVLVTWRGFPGSSSVSRRKLRGPPTKPIIGNIAELLKNMHRLNDWFVDLSKIYGRTFALVLFGRPITFITSDPAVVEHVLKTNFTSYAKGHRFHSIFECLLGDGIFNADGMTWLHQRKIASYMFSVKKFKDHMDAVFQNHAEKVVAKLETCVGNSTTIDIQDLMYRYTLDSITSIAFGESLHTLESSTPIKFASSFDRACKLLVSSRAPFPVWLWKLARAFGTRSEREIDDCVKVLNEFAAGVIGRRMVTVNAGDIGCDLISLFINEGHKDVTYLRDVLFNFMIAGRDTTAIALSWAFYCLYTNPDVEAKAVDEIRTKLGNTPASYESVKTLVYLKAVFFETLRLYPSVPKNVRTALNDDELPDGTFVPKGSVVLYSSYVMGRDSSLWEDPLAFKPERWLTDAEKWREISPFVFNAFNAGPRICLGKNMAITEALILLAYVLPKYKISPVSSDPPLQLADTLTLPMVSHIVGVEARRAEMLNLA